MNEQRDDADRSELSPNRWTESELISMLDDMLEQNNIMMFEDAEVLGHKFRISSVDHGETEKVSRSVKTDDVFTRELSFSKGLLLRAITHIDGRPLAEYSSLQRFLDKSPPAIVNAFYDVLIRVRKAQELRMAVVADAMGKSQASPSEEPSGS